MFYRQPGPQVASVPSGRAWMVGILTVSLVTLASIPLFGNSAGPLTKLTGGFQEGTCVRCHSAHGVNDGRSVGGVFKIDGAPRGYEPGKVYPITVTIAHPGQSRWGFELSARFAESGRQAGSWTTVDKMTQIKTDSEIQYVMHTAEGSRKGEKDGPVEFRVNWTAPATPGGLAIFNAAGNAADASDSPSGDFIYTAGNFSRPAAAAPQEPTLVEVDASPAKSAIREQESSRIVDLPSPVDLKRGSVEVMIQHRFLDSVDAGAGEAFGIDSGANINLAVNYALTGRVSAGISRARFDKIVELSGTYEIRTAKDSWWKLALRGGVEGKDNFHREYSPFLQLASSFDYKILRVNAVPMVTFNSRPDDQLPFNRSRMINPDSNHTFALGLGTDLALNRKYSLLAEYVPRLAGYGGLDERRDQVGAGLVIRTWGHVFTILFASSRDFTPSKYGVNAEDRSLSIGFNLYRRIR
jgi:Membrane bound beta barrel domain (DUF5777)